MNQISKFFLLLFFIVSTNTKAQTILSSTSSTCIGGVVTFTITGTNDSCFYWSFGDGGSTQGTSKVVVHTYTTTSTGHMYINVSTYSDAGCSNYNSSGNKTIFVYDTAAGQIDPLPSEICPNTTIDFGAPGSAISYKWDFGDGSFSTNQYIKHRYTTTGTKNVKLIYYKPCGNDTLQATINVTDTLSIALNPNDLSVNDADTLICPGSKVRFDFSDGDYPDHYYMWYFGDGDSSTYKDPEHLYVNANTYNPMFVITNQCGKSDTAFSHPINVSTLGIPAPSVYSYDYGLNNIHDTLICPNTNIQFKFFRGYDATYFNYRVKWDFGNGDTSIIDNPVYQYTLGGVYTPTFTVSNTCGASMSYPLPYINVSPTFKGPGLYTSDYNVSPSDSVCPGTPVEFYAYEYPNLTYKWYFGDGDSATTAIATHSYSATGPKNITLVTTNNCGLDSAYFMPSFTISNNMHSYLSISSNPSDSSCFGDSISFHHWLNLGSPAISYQWFFGDGNSSTKEKPTHAYSSGGIYSLTLTTSNGCGINDTTYYNYNASGNSSSNVDFTLSNEKICTGESILFTPNNLGYASYYWNFGDGNTSNAISPQHTYNTADDYSNKMYLITTNNCGYSDSLSFFGTSRSGGGDNSFIVYDTLTIYPGADRSIIQGQSTILGQVPLFTPDPGSGITGYWTPSYGLNDTTIMRPIATPTVNTTYYLHIKNGNLCESIDSVTVYVQNSFAGTIFRNNYVDTAKAGFVYLIKWDTTNQVQMPFIDTATINTDGTYSFGYVNQGKYYLLADASTTLYPYAAKTYYGDTAFWNGALIYNHTGNTNNVNISIKEYPPQVGPGKIEGVVKEGVNYRKMKMMGPGDPIKGIDVGLVKKPSPGLVQMTFSDTTNTADSGKFVFSHLPYGNYSLYVDVTGVPVDTSLPTTTFTITPTDTVFSNVNILLDSNLVYMNLGTGIKENNSANEIVVSKIYPNPASSYIDLEIINTLTTNENSVVIFSFYDIRGKEVIVVAPVTMYKGTSFIRINTSTLSDGVYMLNMKETRSSSNDVSNTIVSKVVIVK